jgi:hypothetical protein
MDEIHPATKWYRENKHRPEVMERQRAQVKRWREENRERHLEVSRQKTAAYRKRYPEKAAAATERCRLERGARNKAFIEVYKREHPCVKCGEADPIVLDFHHTDAGTKEFRIAAVIWSHTIAAIEAEIAKCEVLCANCHRREHYRQGL